MDKMLLPHTEKEFTDPSYWRRFFEHNNSSFEWYGDYPKLSAIFEKYLKPTDAILQIGCGNSQLAEELHDNGFRNVLSIDIDSHVIGQQNKRNSIKRLSLKFEVCSASEINVATDNSMNVVIDKGTLDALLPSEFTEKEEEIVQAMFAEVERCMAPFGRYIIVTLAQQHIFHKILHFFGTSRFMLRLHKCELTEANFILPVFVFVITKFKTALEQRRRFEFLNSIEGPPEPMESVEKLFDRVRDVQQMNWFRHYISRGPVDETSVKICSMSGQERYELFVVDDRSLKTLCKYGVFICPSGRESDWLFATPKGRTILRKNCGLHRIVVVRLFRDQHYESLDKIQNELNSIILDFMPKSCRGQRINYLSLGSTDVRENVETGISAISGKWTVEHVFVEGTMYRRLVFLDSSNLVQSEARVERDKQGRWQIDWTKPLCCEHHQHMMLALAFICDRDENIVVPANALKAELNLAVLGLGGGILTKVLHDLFEKSTIVGVELDKEVADIAVKHFDFPDCSERIRVEICDAYEFLKDSANQEAQKYNAIFVDLSGPVNEKGLYCPPPQFVTEEVLILMRESLAFGGVLTLNLVTRDDQLAEEVKRKISGVFRSVYFMKGDEDINEVIICSALAPPKFAHLLNSLRSSRKNNRRSEKAKQEARNGGSGRMSNKWLAECLEEVSKLQHFTI